ncbi:Nucleoside-diphosphate-sugar epimerase [Pustulibacterium marinum]|uniref:Nucleoside-diphosphate-sugar epimerase n=1 Tax=Pustulibacterium marinum TaxID=1224947 RepID=A0A1I7EXZ7_9FLAO|nr:NAD-dependent epimerase/dehydratase family protein [Pustulibacterium marinum]SFU28781.1 Nucleoside-diphosphate-sugar epimerase [Pustulibacterium marinum]
MILVTGATGMVGAHVLVRLLEKQQQVRALYRSEAKIQQLAKSSLFNGKEHLFETIEWVKADIRDVPALEFAFIDVDEVYHCAGFISFNPKDYRNLRTINIDGTANVVNFCIAKQVKKLCYVSSIATLGNPDKDGVVTEKCFWNPDEDHHVYGITKYGAEMEVWRASQEGVPVVIVNPGVIFGADMSSKSMDVFKQVKKGLSFYTEGGSGFVSVDDVVTIMLRLMESTIKNERFIVVSENLSYQTLVTEVAKAVNAKIPSKKATKSLLRTVQFLDWIRGIFTGGSRSFTKYTVQSLHTQTSYSTDKIKEAIDFEFEPMDKVIQRYGTSF